MKHSMKRKKNVSYFYSKTLFFKLTDNEDLSITIDVIILWIKQVECWFVGWIYMMVVNIKALMSRQ
jgi:hypothetical protein